MTIGGFWARVSKPAVRRKSSRLKIRIFIGAHYTVGWWAFKTCASGFATSDCSPALHAGYFQSRSRIGPYCTPVCFTFPVFVLTLRPMETADVVIIGSGIVGSSVAYHLARQGCTNVLVLEREAHQGKGSTGKSMGGVRAQFSTPVNI